MTENEQIIVTFYNAFKVRDYAAMGECYADNATFSDEAFVRLNALQTKAMWKMLCIKGRDLELQYKNVAANDTTGSCEWTATYTFSATGRQVENRIKAKFKFENGKIVEHLDSFDFYKWSSQALGITGVLLGWTAFLKNKVRKTASKNLADFIEADKH
jgi:ketosteroid isomerase-like protein